MMWNMVVRTPCTADGVFLEGGSKYLLGGIVSNKERSTKGDIMPRVIFRDKELALEEVKMKGKLVGGHKRVCCLHGRIWKIMNALVTRGRLHYKEVLL